MVHLAGVNIAILLIWWVFPMYVFRELRSPTGRVVDTHIASIKLLKMQSASCRMAIILSRDLEKNDVPVGTEIWYLRRLGKNGV